MERGWGKDESGGAKVAQLVEHHTENVGVPSATLGLGTIKGPLHGNVRGAFLLPGSVYHLRPRACPHLIPAW